MCGSGARSGGPSQRPPGHRQVLSAAAALDGIHSWQARILRSAFNRSPLHWLMGVEPLISDIS